MIGAWDNKDYETYERIFNFRNERLNYLLARESELMEFGGFSWSDIQRLKPMERRFHIKSINDRLKQKSKQGLE